MLDFLSVMERCTAANRLIMTATARFAMAMMVIL